MNAMSPGVLASEAPLACCRAVIVPFGRLSE